MTLADRDQGESIDDRFRDMLAELAQPVSLPLAAGASTAPGPGTQRFRSTPIRSVEATVASCVARLCTERALAPAAFMEALWALLLASFAAADVVVFGVAGTTRSSRTQLLVPLRARVDAGNGFLAWAQQLSDNITPVRQLAPEQEQLRDWSKVAALQPIFESAVVAHGPADDAPDALAHDVPLTLEVWFRDGIALRARGDASRFSAAALECLLENLTAGLRSIAEQPTVCVKDVSFLTPHERELVTGGFCAHAQDGEPARTIVALFAEQVARNPEELAVVADGSCLSYAELDAQSNALAHHLQTCGVCPDSIVAVCLERTPQLVVALVAILKAGGAYLPLEPTYPKARLQFMLADAAPKVLLTQAALTSALPDTTIPIVKLDADAAAIGSASAGPVDCPLLPDNLAYVLYTSGSTGTPKGVEVPHRAVDRLVKHSKFARFGSDVTILQAAPVAFDASTFEIWGALLNGGKLALYPDALPTTSGLARAIAQHGVTTMWLTAALFNAVIDDDPLVLAPLRQL
ncbi:MAG: linear pentadecapeptide gramicidin synthetase LgrC, partial [Pseudomonadota bacterium]